MIHYCAHCEFKSNHKWVVRRHLEKKHPSQVVQIGKGINYPRLKKHMNKEGFQMNSEDENSISNTESDADSMETNSMDTNFAPSDSEEDESEIDETIYDKCTTLFDKIEEYLDEIAGIKTELHDLCEEIKEDEQKDKEGIRDCMEQYVRLKFKLIDVFEEGEEEEEGEVEEGVEEGKGEEEEEEECSCSDNFLNDFKDAFEDNTWANKLHDKIEEMVKWERMCGDKAKQINYDLNEEMSRDTDEEVEDSGEDEGDDRVDNDYDEHVERLKKVAVNDLEKIANGLANNGPQYFHHCPAREINNISECCIKVASSRDKMVRRRGKPFRKYIRSLRTSNLKKRRNILAKPQVGKGIFTMLSQALPALVSLFKNNKHGFVKGIKNMM